MFKKLCFLATILFSFQFIVCNDVLKYIAQEIEKDLQDCSDKQDCIGKIDKHLANLKQLYDELESFHKNQLPFILPSDRIALLFAVNFVPTLMYLYFKLSNSDALGPKILMGLYTFIWGVGEWNDYGYRKARLIQLASLIRFLEDRKQEKI